MTEQKHSVIVGAVSQGKTTNVLDLQRCTEQSSEVVRQLDIHDAPELPFLVSTSTPGRTA